MWRIKTVYCIELVGCPTTYTYLYSYHIDSIGVRGGTENIYKQMAGWAARRFSFIRRMGEVVLCNNMFIQWTKQNSKVHFEPKNPPPKVQFHWRAASDIPREQYCRQCKQFPWRVVALSAASPKPLCQSCQLLQATFAALTSHAVKHGEAPPGLIAVLIVLMAALPSHPFLPRFSMVNLE